MSADILSISGSGLSAEINPLGAELWALRDADGRDLLWDGDAAFWTGRAPILFPIVGTVAGDTYRIGDAVYTLPRHGFARRRLFSIVVAQPDRVTLRLLSDAETRAVYPFDFELDLSFSIAGARLDVAAAVTNTGTGAMPASFGYHPAFRWPLPYGGARGDYTITFARDETAPIFRPDRDGLLVPAERPPQLDPRVLRLDDAVFADGALVFTSLSGTSLTYGAGAGPKLTIFYPDTPHLGLWSLPGAPFVCVEPWQGYADPAGFTGEIWDKPGMVRLAPGERRRWRVGVELVGSAGASPR